MTAKAPDINARHVAGQRFEPHRGRPMNDDAPPRSPEWAHLPATLHPDFAEAPEPRRPGDFPTDALPPFAAAFVDEYARFSETAPDACATFVLGALSYALAGKFLIRTRPDYEQPLNLHLLVVADSGDRKSDALGAAFAPVRDYEAELVDRWEAGKAEAEAAAEAAKANLAEATRRLKGAPNDHDTQRAFADATRRLEGAKLAPLPQLVAGDITPEALAALMKQQGERTCIAVDEAGFLANALGRYNAAGESNLDVYLQGYSCQPVVVNRGSGDKPPIRMRYPVLAIAAGMQPGALRRAASRDEFRERGMLARFFLSVPRSTAGYQTNLTPPMSLAVKDAYRRTLLAMLRHPTPPPGQRPPYVVMSPAARAVYQAMHVETNPKIRPDGELVHLKDWIAKFHSAVGRVMGVLHFAAAAAEGDLELAYERPIDEATALNAVAIGRYYLAHARHTYEVLLAPPEAARQRSLQAAALATLAWLFPDGRPFVTSAAIAALWPHPKLVPPPDAAFARETIAALAGSRGDARPTLHAFGNALRPLVDKPIEGFTLERRGTAHGGGRRWATVKVSPDSPASPPGDTRPEPPPRAYTPSAAKKGRQVGFGDAGDGGDTSPGEKGTEECPWS